MGSITAKKSFSQQLLFPLDLKLNAQQIEEYKQSSDTLAALGFKAELKNNLTLQILGCPEHCPETKIEDVIETLLSGKNTDRSLEHFSQADQIAKSLAKTLSIKTGQFLAPEEQQVLLNDFFGCKETNVSPFNKPIFITLEKSEIERKLN